MQNYPKSIKKLAILYPGGNTTIVVQDLIKAEYWPKVAGWVHQSC